MSNPNTSTATGLFKLTIPSDLILNNFSWPVEAQSNTYPGVTHRTSSSVFEENSRNLRIDKKVNSLSEIFKEANFIVSIGNTSTSKSSDKVTVVQSEFLAHTILREIKEIENLPSDWDSYGAPQIDSQVLGLARSIIGDILFDDCLATATSLKGYVAPLSSGGVVLALTLGHKQLRVKLYPNPTYNVLFQIDDNLPPKEGHKQFPFAVDSVKVHLKWLLEIEHHGGR